ncbi:hypothetical protein AMK26_01800 [Streptomyces sp. CB03234]|uniref:hypothetical protein n=1 Tax=Streptomyces sp. (strain CB03234) TaxID=1703937 RepID=UPI00093F1D33|nr:hypothetical protein [Streptomyces sp. CB03234]OKK07824.1 hypothetical protein AMK26_01800 [Streptomyces sp. CB03234]
MALRKLTAALVAAMALLATTLGLSATATAATGGGDRQDATVRAVTTDPDDDGKDNGKDDGKDDNGDSGDSGDDGRGNVLKNPRAERNRNTIFTTPGAYSASAGHNGNPVWYVAPC